MLPCPTCGANIDARNDALAIAACGQCGGLFEWPLIPAPLAPIDRTPRVGVERREGIVRAIRWRSKASVAVVAVALLVACLSPFFYLLGGEMMWTPLLLTLFVLVMGLWPTLQRAVGIHVRLGPVISSRSGVGSQRRFSAASLRQLFIRRRGSPANPSYDLFAIQADGTVVPFAEGFPSPRDARSAKHELEAALGMTDAPVPGEIDRDVPIVADTTAPLRATWLVCPACGASVTAHEVQLRKGQAVCAGCGKGILVGGPVAVGPRALVVLPPTRAVVDRSPDAFALEAGLGTGEPGTVRRLALGTFAAAASYTGFSLALEDGDHSLFLLWALAFGTGWSLAVGRWNRVRIRVEQGVLHVHIGPLPPVTRRTIPLADISQIFVRKQPKPSFWSWGWSEPVGDRYQLCVVERSSMEEFQVFPLVDHMSDLHEARYLEEQLEQYLGIVDAPVPDEVAGKMLRHQAGAPSLPGGGNLSLPDASSGGELSVPVASGALSDPDT